MDPLGGPGAALGREVVQRGVRRAQILRVRPQRGHRVHRRLQPLGHAVDQTAHLRMAQGDRGQRTRQRRVHLRGGPPDGPRLGGEVLPLGQLPQRQLPAVGGALHERLEHPRTYGSPVGDGPAGSPASVTSHAVGGGTGAALAGQRQRQLQVRVDAGHHPAHQLQNVGVAVDDRRVRLLGGHQARHQAGPYLLARVTLETKPADPGLGAQGLQEQVGGPGVVQGLVDRPSGQGTLRHMTDQRGRQPGGSASRTPMNSW